MQRKEWRMRAVQGWVARLPLWGVFLLFFLIWGLLMLGFDRLVYPDRPVVLSLIVWPIASAGFAGVMTALTARTRRRLAGSDVESSVTRALRDDALPNAATADEWSPVLLRRRVTARVTLVMNPIVFGFFTAVSVVLAVTADSNQRIVGIVLAPVFVAFAVWSVVSSRRTIRTCDALLTQLAADPER